MPMVASALGVSERSLRRHLTEEGKPYPRLVNEALAVLAKSHLLDERRTIAETALELGFADNTAFHRAFKRWTGLTPAEYRKQQTAVANDAGASQAAPVERVVG
jgi:AraC-like DNA-binding protein